MNNNDNEREVLLPIFPKDDFHKLLFANHHIKEQDKLIRELRIEIGMLKSEIDEICHSSNVAKKNKGYKAELKSLRNQNRKLKIEVERLRTKLLNHANS